MKIAKLGLILLIITAIAATILGFANDKTAVLIEKTNEEANNEARKAALPSAEEFEELDEAELEEIKKEKPEVLDVFKGIKGGEVVGYTVKTGPVGYAGPVEIISGINVEKKIEGVRIGNNSETPGLGALAAEESFYGQFSDKDAAPLEVVKSAPSDNQILAITGATITSAAVTNGVNTSIEVVEMLSK